MNRRNGRIRSARTQAIDATQDHRTPEDLPLGAREQWVDLTDVVLGDSDRRADRLSNAVRTRYGWIEEEGDEDGEARAKEPSTGSS